jgi:hypothetical protein
MAVLDFFQQRLDVLMKRLPNDKLRAGFDESAEMFRSKMTEVGAMEIPITASLLISMLLSECAAMSLGGSLTFAMRYRTIGQVKRDGVANVSAEERHRCSTSQALTGAL